jgi:hypothetical protein
MGLPVAPSLDEPSLRQKMLAEPTAKTVVDEDSPTEGGEWDDHRAATGLRHRGNRQAAAAAQCPPGDAEAISPSAPGDTACAAGKNWGALLDLVLTLALGLAGAMSRAHRLNEPPTPVFDEYHVGRFTNWFGQVTSSFLASSSGVVVPRIRFRQAADSFDLHPPLLKMVYHGVAAGLGFRGAADCSYGAADPFVADHTVPFERCDSIWTVRAVAAACGAMLPPVAFCHCRVAGLSRTASLLAGWLLLCENLFFGLARLHMLDMPCTFLVAATVLSSVLAQNASAAAGDHGPSTRYLGWLLVGGVLLGLALSAKFAMALPTLLWVGLHNLNSLLGHCFAADEPTSRWRLEGLLLDAASRGVLLLGPAVGIGLGRIVAFYDRSSTSYHIV